MALYSLINADLVLHSMFCSLLAVYLWNRYDKPFPSKHPGKTTFYCCSAPAAHQLYLFDCRFVLLLYCRRYQTQDQMTTKTEHGSQSYHLFLS